MLLGKKEFKDSVDTTLASVTDTAAAKCDKASWTYSFDSGWTAMSFEWGQREDFFGNWGMTYQLQGSVTVTAVRGGGYRAQLNYRTTAFKSWNFDQNESLKGIPFLGAARAVGYGAAREFAVVGIGSQQLSYGYSGPPGRGDK